MEITKEVKDLGTSNIQLDIKIGKSDVKKSYAKIVDKYAKTVQLPGFRKGKVPVSVLENKVGEALRAETGYELVEKALSEIFENAEKDIKPLNYAQPELEGELKLDPETDFSFSVKYDVYPKVDLKKVDGFDLECSEVTNEEAVLEQELKNIQLNNSFVMDKKDDELAKKEDIATVNYCELDADGKEIKGTQRQDYAFEIGSGLNLYKFDDDILGMKKGEEKVINKKFPKDFEDKDLAGTKKTIKVKLTALKYRDMPKIDDELAQDVSEKYKTLDDLKSDLKSKIHKAVEDSIENEKIDAYLKAVVEANEFVLPASMINAEINMRWANLARQMGMSAEDFDKFMKAQNKDEKENFSKLIEPDAVMELKKRIVINALLEINPEITATDEDIEKKYKEIAEGANIEIAEVKERYNNATYKQYLIEAIKDEKLFKQMLEKCKIKKGKKIAATEFLKRQGQ